MAKAVETEATEQQPGTQSETEATEQIETEEGVIGQYALPKDY